MSFKNIKDRVPSNVLPNGAIRYGVYDQQEKLNRYEYIKREDEPLEMGTPINKALFDNIQGDLYTYDRYNMPRVGWLETDLYETTFSDNIFPSSWEKENDNSFYSADVLLTTSSARSGDYGPDAFTTDAWWTNSVTNAWIQIQFPQGIKITKMKLIMSTGSSSQTSTKKILGSKDGQDWVVLYSTSGNVETSATVRTLSNADYYSYYKVEFTNSASFQVYVKEWQVTEYKVKGVYGYELDLPLDSYETGKIINIEGQRVIDETAIKYDTYTTDFLPKIWTQTSETGATTIEFTADDGTKISSINSQAYRAFDGDFSTYWKGFTSSAGNALLIEFPEAKKITKIDTYITIGSSTSYTPDCTIQGSFNGVNWIDLAYIGTVQTSLTRVQLENTNFYKYYRFYFKTELANQPRIYEVQVSEWQEVSGEPVYITSFANPYLNINNLGIKPINGTINYGEKYTLVYNGGSWNVISGKVVSGKFTAVNSTDVDINVGFYPDLVIIYQTNNNALSPSASQANAYNYQVPMILTKAYTSGSNKVLSTGFRFKQSGTVSSSYSTLFYIAIKF